MGRAFEYRRAAKEKRWDKMSKVFPKLAKAITAAAKEGGIDPDMNAKLRSAINNAKAQNMPKDNIDAAIKRASGKDGSFYFLTYEGKAPHGVLLMIDCTTDNPTRTIANLKSYFNKTNASIVPNGSLEFMFTRKSVFDFKFSGTTNLEDLELNLIDFGLESLEPLEDGFRAYASYQDFGSFHDGLVSLGAIIVKSSLERIANSPISLDDQKFADIERLLDMIEDDDDVEALYTNIE